MAHDKIDDPRQIVSAQRPEQYDQTTRVPVLDRGEGLVEIGGAADAHRLHGEAELRRGLLDVLKPDYHRFESAIP